MADPPRAESQLSAPHRPCYDMATVSTSSKVDRILETIDAGLQTPVPDPTFGEVSPVNNGRCARCQQHEAADGDLCPGCRAYLLGDSDDDPVVSTNRSWISHEVWDEVRWEVDPERIAAIHAMVERAAVSVADWALQYGSVMVSALREASAAAASEWTISVDLSDPDERGAFRTYSLELSPLPPIDLSPLPSLQLGDGLLAEPSLPEPAQLEIAAPSPIDGVQRRRERELLDRRRRAQRRTNRWGPALGR